jgi:hypothetical protein
MYGQLLQLWLKASACCKHKSIAPSAPSGGYFHFLSARLTKFLNLARTLSRTCQSSVVDFFNCSVTKMAKARNLSSPNSFTLGLLAIVCGSPYDSEDERWIRVIEVKEDFTIEELHDYIQEIVGFDNDHMYEFFIGKNRKNISGAISEHTNLNEIYPMTGVKLYYFFDYGGHWIFQIKKSRKRVVEDVKVKYPRIVKSMGVNPEQYPEYGE